MSFTMPTHRPITQNRTIHSTVHKLESQCTTPSMNLYSVYDGDVGKMYPERNNLPQNIMDAYRLRDGVTY